MNRTEKIIKELVSEANNFVQSNPQFRESDRIKIQDFITKIWSLMTVELVKRDLIEEQLMEKVVLHFNKMVSDIEPSDN
ncbi:hypothetical protein [Dyadobacter sp. LHD-138]|uniref:hypothetical protein n=1 Tax=Dyadobacter sp. LHD-138 TaxID=3071413 RepID=UPI0027E164F6|nr:hypothetical protein [Dyadobacter sp. LHD-138]MDQ6482353.1 hypothetical protein [Dyadobacter sp. LHD-138]